MARPVLVLDAYVETDSTPTWQPVIDRAGRPVERVRVARGEPLPDDPRRFAAVIQTGSAACLPDGVDWAPPMLAFLRRMVDASVPYLGVCWGHQALAEAVGGEGSVVKRAQPEVGVLEVEVTAPDDPLLRVLGPRFDVMISHEDEVGVPVPAGMTVLARSAACPTHGLRVDGRPIWGVQFHAEMSRVEVEALLAKRSRKHPELGLDPVAGLARFDATPSVRDRLVDRFYGLVDVIEAGGRVDDA